MASLLVVFVLLCGISAQVASEECADSRASCPDISYCKIGGYLEKWMALNCRKTCGLCSAAATECGKPEIQGIRVIAGKTAVRGSWPWQILMMFRGRPMCGGTLIAPQWVVTAAHCVYGSERKGGFSIRVGEQDRKVFEGSEVTVDVETVIRHEDYNPRTLNNDIAMFKLRKPVVFNKYVSPACLPAGPVPVGSTCYVTGWGKIRHPGRMTRHLQQGMLPVVSNEDCFEKNKEFIPIPVTPAMLCAGSGGTERTSGCHGDSGGPFVCKVDGAWELHGSVSYGSSVCKSTQTYTVLSRTYYFLDWIKATMTII